jgi:hypothetical protein
MAHRFYIAFLSIVASIAVANAAPILTVGAGACPANPDACSQTNGIVTATLFNLFYIDPSNDTTGAYTNLFKLAFDTWNAAQPPFRRWSLVALSLSNTATLEVDVYRAFIGEGDHCDPDVCGGAEIDVRYTKGNAADPRAITDPNNIDSFDAVWSQSILTNDKRDAGLPGNPYLDGNPMLRLGPPVYPFQYEGSSLYDKPSRDADSIWLGQSFLTQAYYTNRVLIVYGGIGWGFYVQSGGGGEVPAPVPEPSMTLLFACAAIGCMWRGRALARICGTLRASDVMISHRCNKSPHCRCACSRSL